jgi:hypothetical protein
MNEKQNTLHELTTWRYLEPAALRSMSQQVESVSGYNVLQ